MSKRRLGVNRVETLRLSSFKDVSFVPRAIEFTQKHYFPFPLTHMAPTMNLDLSESVRIDESRPQNERW